MNDEFFHIGNLSDNLNEIKIQYFSKRMEEIRMMCIGCPIIKFCKGGCAENIFRLFDTIYKIDENYCKSMINKFENEIWYNYIISAN